MTHVSKTIGRFCKEALAELFPSVCDTELSRAEETGWQIDSPQAYCSRCGASAGPGSTTANGCAFCIGQPVPWDRVTRLCAYSKPASEWIISMKFHGMWSWAGWFGQRLGAVIDDPADRSNMAVCPVPMHWARRVWRGYNQAHLIAAALAAQRRRPLIPLLKRTRHTRPQTTVAASDRLANIRDSFEAIPVDLTGWHILLVDDVKTSGSTLSACTKLLKQAGANRVSVAVATVADPSGGDFKMK